MKFINNIQTLLFLSWIFGVFIFSSCTSDPASPGITFMPDMYESKSLETYGENAILPNGMTALTPPENTIPRGFVPYHLENTPQDYERSATEITNPIPYSESVLSEGKEIYGKFCVQCHGASGKGDGNVAVNPNFPGPPPAYDGPQLKDLPEGKIFHSITYGKGMMGSHASQLSVEDRWKIVHYIQKLQGKNQMESINADEGNSEQLVEEQGNEG